MQRSVTLLAAAILIAAAVIDAWAGRRSYVGGDSVSYMDMASGMAAGDASYAVSGHWSPLYPAIIAIFLRAFDTSVPQDFAVARGVNILVFIATFLMFRIFLNKLLDYVHHRSADFHDRLIPIPRLPLTIIGYTLLAWGCFSLTFVSRISPDVAVMAMLFATSACLLGFAQGEVSRARFALFGAVLGVGYLLKAIFFPLSAAFLLIAALQKPVWAVRSRLVISIVCLGVIAAPLVAAISIKYGRPTFGESGRVSYWWEVQQIKQSQHWQGVPAETGTPVHPTRQLMRDPDVFEFGTPFVATYSPWYDPSYWNAGINVHVDPILQLRAIARGIRSLLYLFFEDRFAAALAIAVAILLLGARTIRTSATDFFRLLPVWGVGVAVVGIYVLILVSTRYIAGALPLIALALIAVIGFRSGAAARGYGMAAAVVCLLGLALQCGPRLAAAGSLIVAHGGDVRNEMWLVAEEFRRLGIPPGTRVAAIDQSIGEEWSQAPMQDWARLAGVRIVSEIPDAGKPERQFWSFPPDRRREALETLRRTGARAVVASGVPKDADTTGWTQLADSRLFYRLFD